jgi:predicted ChrR family anti-sigma factor
MDEALTPYHLVDLFNIDINDQNYTWQPFRDGVQIYPIYKDDSGASAALLKYEAGAQVPVHEHPGYEHILVLAGSQTDGQRVYEKGQLMISQPGSQHQIRSDTGCVVLAIWQKPVQFI